MTSPAAVLEMVRRGRTPLPRIAIVTAATSGTPMSVTVRFVEGGATFRPLVLTHLPLPAVGSHCLILPADGGWVYAGAVADPSGAVDYRTVDLLLEHNWHKSNSSASPTPWQSQSDRGSSGYVEQGRWGPQEGGPGAPTPTALPTVDYATILLHNLAALDAIAAAAGTVHLVELVMTRTDLATPVQASPRMYGHQYTASSPPVVGQEPVPTPGFGPLSLPGFSSGQTARWVLPAAWTTALASSAIEGIGFYSESTADRFFSSPEGSALALNARLVVTYTAPTDLWE
ncbi:hypothetical protein GCM10009718_36970 [Isoptericola halotolerans]|uniref:Uncharacterized protein n=1 Tax=Isoptericola halotolerans TaxID=300560 RepID=A0ABX2A5U7_9MICO|nr:hypothetical protein [Isoptericola halotolerans]NOV98227.1 hypothetical protein [Isoptericola halotolerans]